MSGILLAFKGVRYLCAVAVVPGTAVVTYKHHNWIEQKIERPMPKRARVVHRAAPKPKTEHYQYAREVTHEVATVTPIEVPAEPLAPVLVAQTELCTPPGGGDFGSGSYGGGFWFGGGAGTGLPPVSVTPLPTSPVPEPSTWGYLSVGMFGIGGALRYRKRK